MIFCSVVIEIIGNMMKMSSDNLTKGANFATYMQQNGNVFRIYSKKDNTTFITTYFVD